MTVELIRRIESERQRGGTELDVAWGIYLQILNGQDEGSEILPIIEKLGIEQQTVATHAQTVEEIRKLEREASELPTRRREWDKARASYQQALDALRKAKDEERAAFVANEVAGGIVRQALHADARIQHLKAQFGYLFGLAPRPFPIIYTGQTGQPKGPRWADESSAT